MNKVKLFRFNQTLSFMSRYIDHRDRILDLGTPNELGELLKKNNFDIQNAHGFDFDLDPAQVNNYEYDVLTRFRGAGAFSFSVPDPSAVKCPQACCHSPVKALVCQSLPGSEEFMGPPLS